MGSIPGYRVKTGDAKGPTRGGRHIWVNRFRRPAVPVIMALYGHADAGGIWEEQCEGKFMSIGFKRLAEEWPGVFWHEETTSLLIVYVDDFKLAGNKTGEDDTFWKSIREVIDMGPNP